MTDGFAIIRSWTHNNGQSNTVSGHDSEVNIHDKNTTNFSFDEIWNVTPYNDRFFNYVFERILEIL